MDNEIVIVYLHDGEVKDVELVANATHTQAALRAENRMIEDFEPIDDDDDYTYVVIRPTRLSVNEKGEIIE